MLFLFNNKKVLFQNLVNYREITKKREAVPVVSKPFQPFIQLVLLQVLVLWTCQCYNSLFSPQNWTAVYFIFFLQSAVLYLIWKHEEWCSSSYRWNGNLHDWVTLNHVNFLPSADVFFDPDFIPDLTSWFKKYSWIKSLSGYDCLSNVSDL